MGLDYNLLALEKISKVALDQIMSSCKTCFHPCHCGEDNDLHADEYGVCTCEKCTCKRTYKKEKDHSTDITYENE